MVIISTEMFVWWEAPIIGRGEWIYTGMESGAPFLVMVLILKKLTWCADNLDMTHNVSCNTL